MSYYFLLQGIFLSQGSNPHLLHLLHWQAGSLPLAPPGKPGTHVGWRSQMFLNRWWLPRMHSCTLFMMAKGRRQLRGPSTKEWMEKMGCVCPVEYYSTVRWNKVRAWMDLETVTQSEVSQKRENKYCILTHTCGLWYRWSYLQKRQRHRPRQQMYGHKGGSGVLDAQGDWDQHISLLMSACSVAQSCPTCGPMNCSLPGSSVHGVFPARTLEWVAIS